VLDWNARPLILGIVNVTPDSFSDGGQHFSCEAAVEFGLSLVNDGADVLDIGGESTRPGALPVPLDEELRRVIPVVERLSQETTVPLSVDTYKADVARHALEAGASIVNDVTGLQGDRNMLDVVRRAEAGAIVMHMQGTPQTMQMNPHYDEVVHEVRDYLADRLCSLVEQGLDREQLVIDPGIGFGKRGAHNWELLARLGEFQQLGRPLCLGVSRKGFIGKIIGRAVAESLAGSLAIAVAATLTESAQILRVHDVKETRDALTVLGKVTGKW
jgi:dihydropteroate synthase